LFHKSCMNRIQITTGVRRLRKEFRNLISVTQMKDEDLGGVNVFKILR